MFKTKLFAIAAAAVMSASVSAAPLTVTLNPSATNGGLGVLNGGFTPFTADGATGSLGSKLTIGSFNVPGAVAYEEVGTVRITGWQGGTGPDQLFLMNPASLSGFGVYATFTLSGLGVWSDVTVSSGAAKKFTAVSAALTNGKVFGVQAGNAYTNTAGQLGSFELGSLTLNPAVGLITATSLVTEGGTKAENSLSATFSFTPASGTSGPGGFWSLPVDFNIDFLAANVGSGVGNTVLTPNPAETGEPLVLKTLNYADGNIGGNGSFNIAFETRTNETPEPGALALVGLALAGLAIARRKKA